MTDKSNDIGYSREVIEFITVAKEFCNFLENTVQYPKPAFIDTTRKILPLLYLKISVLPKMESEFEEGTDKFVTESDWYKIHDSILNKLGGHNDYLEVFDKAMQFSEEPVTGSIAENIADIYQDLKDLVINYSFGNEIVTNEALWECQLNFEEFWGQKLVNSLRALHLIRFSGDDLEEKEEKKTIKRDTSNWFIQQRQDEFKRTLEDDDL